MKKIVSFFMAMAMAFTPVQVVHCAAEEIAQEETAQTESASFADKAKIFAKKAYQMTKNGVVKGYECWNAKTKEEKHMFVTGLVVMAVFNALIRCCLGSNLAGVKEELNQIKVSLDALTKAPVTAKN